MAMLFKHRGTENTEEFLVLATDTQESHYHKGIIEKQTPTQLSRTSAASQRMKEIATKSLLRNFMSDQENSVPSAALCLLIVPTRPCSAGNAEVKVRKFTGVKSRLQVEGRSRPHILQLCWRLKAAGPAS